MSNRADIERAEPAEGGSAAPPTAQYQPVRRRDDASGFYESPDTPVVPPEVEMEQIRIARKLFYGGLACLPWLWIVNLIYFRRKVFNLQVASALRKWLVYSLFGATVITVALIIWISLYQTKHNSWDETGSKLTLYSGRRLWFRENGPWRDG